MYYSLLPFRSSVGQVCAAVLLLKAVCASCPVTYYCQLQCIINFQLVASFAIVWSLYVAVPDDTTA